MTNPPYALDRAHEIWHCWIDGHPVPKKETRVTYNKKRGKHHGYTDEAVENWKQVIGVQLREGMTEKIFPIAQPLVAHFIYHFEAEGEARRMMIIGDDKYLSHADFPDYDNLSKPVCDALQDVGVIANDKLIYSATNTKVWDTRGSGLMIRLYSCVAAIDLGGGTRRL